MDKASAEIEIELPFRIVFAFTSNLKNLPHWADVVEVKESEISPRIVGNKYIAVTKTLFSKDHLTLEITAFDSPTNFAFKNHATKSDFVLTFESTKSGTKVTLQHVVESFSFALSGRKLLKFLTNLKKYLEENKSSLANVDELNHQEPKKQILHRDA